MSVRVRRLAAVSLAVVAACGSPPVETMPTPLPEPDVAGVDRAIFILGDPGQALERHHPILPHLAREVERWSGALGRDSAVVVLNLGDIIYPNGMHHPDDREDFPVDSAIVTDQIDIVSGPDARAHHTALFFLAGNHDWGSEQHEEGVQTIQNLDDFLTAHREIGLNVRLLPRAGEPGPAVIDFGDDLRIVFLDTAWWLLQTRGTLGDSMLAGVERALRDAGDRHVVVAAHHPYITAGPHGGELSFLEELGIGYVLKRSGAILQDLNSPPYRRLRAGLADIFERAGQPLLFAGGHEHSLQLIEGRNAEEPRFNIVSGSASKLTRVGTTEGLRFKLSAPGYFLLLIRTDGSADLHAVAAPEDYLHCPETPAAALERCMADGIEAYRVRYSQTLTE